MDRLRAREIDTAFHYVPLHSAPGGQHVGRAHGELGNTDRLSAGLVRLPLWTAMGEPEVERVIDAVREAVKL
jgi:dTDP-4-amino-4,6-dideoxygalactose transaminase